MAPRPERAVLRERYDRRRAQVVLGAARVFARSGYDQTSVPELADALGMAAGALYHYFGGKEELLIAICDQLMEPLLVQARALLAAGGPPAERLRALLRVWVAHVIEHRDHMLVFQQERHVIERGEQWAGVRENRKRFERLLDGALREAREARVTRLADDRLLLSALLGMVNHTAQWHRPRGRLSAEEIADGYAELVLKE
ncbi:MAG: TetR family transcriptional regulator [Solirubrobacterales bacterium]|nr:TetR family transcriptional regulator [Solirubrobacterales bacterium]MBV9715160.1 TetR family transcriptional regulator [Solirubrobacterales bacterium]